MKKIAYKLCIYMQVFLLISQGSIALAVNPLDPDVEKYTVSFKGSSWDNDKRIHTQSLRAADDFTHFVLDPSLWELPEGEGFGLAQNNNYILSAFHKDGILHVQTKEKELFLHPGENNKLSSGSLFFESKGSFTLVRGKLSGESYLFGENISFGVNSKTSIDFMESLTCRAKENLENKASVKGKKGTLVFQSKDFSNKGKLEFKQGLLGFETGVNEEKGFIRSWGDLFVSGKSSDQKSSKHHRFSKFENKGEIIGWWIVNFDGRLFSQTETGRILTATIFQGSFDVYREAGKIRSLEQIQISANHDMEFLEGGFVHSKIVNLSSGSGLTLKSKSYIKSHYSLTLDVRGNFVCEKDGRIDLFGGQQFSYADLYKGKESPPSTKEISKKISTYIEDNRPRLGFNKDFRSGMRINVHRAFMKGGISCKSGSFILNAEEGNIDSIIKGGLFSHSDVIISIEKLDFRGSIEAVHALFDSVFGNLKGLIDAPKITFEGGVFNLGRNIKTNTLENAAHTRLERGISLEAEEITMRGGSFDIPHSAVVRTPNMNGFGNSIKVEGGGDFEAQILNLSLQTLNIKPKGSITTKRGSLFVENLVVENSQFDVEKELSIMAEKARMEVDSLNVFGSFSAVNADLNLEKWRNYRGSHINIRNLAGTILQSEFWGDEANFQNVRIKGDSISVHPGSNMNVYGAADIALSGDFQLGDNGYFGNANFNVRRLLGTNLETPFAHIVAREMTVDSWRGDQIQGTVDHINIAKNFNARTASFRGQDLMFSPASRACISGDGRFDLSNTLTFGGGTQIGNAWVRVPTLNVPGILQTVNHADVIANDVTITGGWTGSSLNGRLGRTHNFGLLGFQDLDVIGKDFITYGGSRTLASGEGRFNLSNTLTFGGDTQIGNAWVRVPTLNVPGILQTVNNADVIANDVTITGGWTGSSLNGRFGRTHNFGYLRFQDLNVTGQDFRTYDGSQTFISGDGRFNLSNSFQVGGRTQVGNIWVNANTIDVPGFLQTGYGNFNANRGHITGTLKGDNLHGSISSLYNSGTFRSQNRFDFKGDYLKNFGFLGGDYSTRLDYNAYDAFGDLSSQNLWMRIDDRNLGSHDLFEIGHRSCLGHLEILTHNDAFFRQGLHLKHGLTLTAPAIAFAADSRVFRLFGMDFWRPGKGRFVSDQDLIFRTTKGGFFVKDFEIEGQRTSVESAGDMNFYGSTLKGRTYLGMSGERDLNLIRTHRPSQLIGGQGEIKTVFVPRLDRYGCPIPDERGSYVMDAIQEHVGLNVQVSGRLYNDVSHIFSKGSLLVSAEEGITASPRVLNHSESHTKRTFWGKKKTTSHCWQEVLRPMIGSSDGRALLYSSRAGIDLRAVDVVGSQGLTVMGRDDIRIFDIITRTDIKTSKSFGWGLKRSTLESKVENSEPTWIVSPSGNITVISQDKGIHARGAYFVAPHLSFAAKEGVLFSISPLSEEHTHTKEAFFVKPRILHMYDVLTSENFKEGFSKLTPLTQRLAAFGESEGGFNRIAAGLSAGISGWNAYKSFGEMGNIGGFLGNQMGILNSAGDLNTSVEFGYKRSSSRIRFIRRGEGGLLCSSLSVVSSQKDIIFENAVPVKAPESIFLRAPKGGVIQRGFESYFENSNKAESVSVDVDVASGSITGGNLHSSGSKTAGRTWSPQILESRNIIIYAKRLEQDAARITADYFEGEVEYFTSRTRQDSLDHHHWSASLSFGKGSPPSLVVSYGNQEERLTSDRSGISLKNGVLRARIISTTGSFLEFGDASVFAREIHTESLHDYREGEERGISFTPGTALHSIGVVFGKTEYAAIENSKVSGTGILVDGRPFVYLPPSTEVMVDRHINLAFEIPIPAKGAEKATQKQKPEKSSVFRKKDEGSAAKDFPQVSSAHQSKGKEFLEPVKEEEGREGKKPLKVPDEDFQSRSLDPAQNFSSKILLEEISASLNSEENLRGIEQRSEHLNSFFYKNYDQFQDKRTWAERVLNGEGSKILGLLAEGKFEGLSLLERISFCFTDSQTRSAAIHDFGRSSWASLTNSWDSSWGQFFEGDKQDPSHMIHEGVELFLMGGSLKSIPSVLRKGYSFYEKSTGNMGEQKLIEGGDFNLTWEDVTSFENETATRLRLKRDLPVVRLCGNKSIYCGSFVTTVTPKTPQEAANSLSLGEYNSLEGISRVKIPAGTEILVGRVAPQRSMRFFIHENEAYLVPQNGGGRQIFIPRKSVSDLSWETPKKLFDIRDVTKHFEF